MLRWNGWGYESIVFPLSETAKLYLGAHLGPPEPPPDVPRPAVPIPAPRAFARPHPLLIGDDEIRLRHARGQSFPDLIAKRFGRIERFPDAVAFPEKDDDLRELLDGARGAGAQVSPFGGGTSVVGGVNPAAGDDRPVLTLSLARLNDLRDLDETSRLATFGAGISGPLVEAQLQARGFTLGHYPQSFEHSTLGGWIATRSSGQQSLGYGRIEALFAGGTLATPAGPLRLPPFPASAAGPDLRQLILGSEGRLGIIAEAVVRVRPLPESEAFYGVMFPDWATGMAACRAAVQTGLSLSMLRLSTPAETETFLQLPAHQRQIGWLRTWLRWWNYGPERCLMLFGLTGRRAAVTPARREMAALCRRHGGLWLTEMVGRQWARSRFRSAYLRDSLWEHGYAVDTLETALPWSGVPAAAEKILSALGGAASPVLPMVHLSHFYPDGASLYFTFLFRVGRTAEETLARWRALKEAGSRAVVAAGGTISHQHGVGLDHRPYLIAEKGALGLSALEHARQAFDPQGIMNPGKLL